MIITKGYLDEKLAAKLGDDDTKIFMNNFSLKANKSGDTFSGNINMQSYKITSSSIPTNDEDFVNKRFIDNI